MKRRTKLIVLIVAVLGISQLAALAILFYFNYPAKTGKVSFGVTFSPMQARYLGLNPQEVLKNSLDDLGIKNYRLSAYWNVIEENKNRYDFSELDWQINEIEKRNGNVILAVGRRLPRWPECHEPEWVKSQKSKVKSQKLLEYIEATVKRYKNRAVIFAWQIENEPFLAGFGECPPLDAEFFEKEIKLVHSLDSRPVVITESGELSNWLVAAHYGDMVGISIYRTVWTKLFGWLYYPLTPGYYRLRARSIEPFVKKVFVSELQAEPWLANPLPATPIAEQKAIMNEKKLVESINFTKAAGFDTIYLWGVEWWAWLKAHSDPGMWEAVKNIVANK
ncbi:MAG: beta-galactosidase [bacterium]